MDYLTRKGQTFYARIPVPQDLQQQFQTKEFKQTHRSEDTLHTPNTRSIISLPTLKNGDFIGRECRLFQEQ